MKKPQRREIEAFSMSFLDAVCCGFGAIILMLVLTKTAEPVILEEVSPDLDGVIAELEKQLFEIRGETRRVTREIQQTDEQLAKRKKTVARLEGDLSKILGQYAASKQESSVTEIIEGKLSTAQQELSEEMQRLLGSEYRRKADDQVIGGVPVDSEYIIFIIDTSGSMFSYSWPMVLQKVDETLRVHPEVKGIQVMNDMGNYMFSRYNGRWIPDSPARRKAIVDRLRTWNPFSNSSPVEGINRAISTFYAPDKKISLYVFGDEFTGGSIQRVVDTVDRINQVDPRTGRRRVRIHAVGFPVQFARPSGLQTTGMRFATLMRILCERNDGTFVGLERAF
ncbi:MAG: VWA domain-containing protein [Pseudomonadota bacterium]